MRGRARIASMLPQTRELGSAEWSGLPRFAQGESSKIRKRSNIVTVYGNMLPDTGSSLRRENRHCPPVLQGLTAMLLGQRPIGDESI